MFPHQNQAENSLVSMILLVLPFSSPSANFPLKLYIDLSPDESWHKFALVLEPVLSRARKNSSIVGYGRGWFGMKSYWPSDLRFNMLGAYCRHLLSFGAVSFLLVMIFMALDCPASFPSCPPGPRCCSELQYSAVNSSLGTIVHAVLYDFCMITCYLDFLIPYPAGQLESPECRIR